ncbi:MAG: NADH-quinone oxidoreductase subunit NuoE, partial [Rhizomicrobium sp.]
AKYPQGRQASAVIALLWRGQAQEGWVTHPMIETVARRLSMPFIRVLEVATFYTMFNLEPVGTHLVQVCTTTPCWLAGSDQLVEACKTHIRPEQHRISADGKFTWMEVECLGACVNAPMLQIGKDFYEDMDGPLAEKLIENLRAGRPVRPGPQKGRHSSEPAGGPTTLGDRSLYDGSVIDRQRRREGADASDRNAPQQKPPGAAT